MTGSLRLLTMVPGAVGGRHVWAPCWGPRSILVSPAGSRWLTRIRSAWGAEDGCREESVSWPWNRGLAEDICALAGSLLYNSRGRHPHCFCLRSLGSAGWGTWSVFVPLVLCVSVLVLGEEKERAVLLWRSLFGALFWGFPVSPHFL